MAAEPAAPDRREPDLPLSGIRVVELSDGRGEMCGRFLADLGADVLLIEPPGGSAARRTAPLFEGTSLYHATQNANKRSRELDLTAAAGREQLLALIEDAHIFIETEPAGRLAGLGLGAEAMHARNAALVVTSITEFGQSGPYRDWSATDFVHMALNTVLSRSGAPGERPLMPPGALPSQAAAMQAAWATLVAFWRALDTGVGDHVDASVFESSIQSIDPVFGMAGTAVGSKAASDLPRHRPDARRYYPIFHCSDGYVRICTASERQWRSMVEWLGDLAASDELVWDTALSGQENLVSLHPRCAEHFDRLTVAESIAGARDRGIPIDAVLTPADVLANEHFEAREVWARVELPGGAVGAMPDGFVEIDGARAGIRSAAPAAPEGGEGGFEGPEPAYSTGGGHPAGDGHPGPLSGLRVLDLGVIVVGGETGRLFADLGADVVKVENRNFPDGMRLGVLSRAFGYGARNKRSVGIDLRAPEGREVFLKLVAEADVVLSNFKSGTMDALGLGHEELRAANPAIVAVESTALGSWGPASGNMGYGPLVRAFCGLTSVWRYPEQPEGFCDSITIYPDHAAARISAVAALAALIRRRRTGTGAVVQSAQSEVILGQLSELFLAQSLEPGAFEAAGNSGQHEAPFGVYPCAGDDEWCVVTVRGDEDWRRLCEVIGEPDLASDSELRDSSGRVGQRERIDRAVGLWTAARTPQHVTREMQKKGVPAAPMIRPGELLMDPHLISREFFSNLSQPDGDDLPTERGPAKFDLIAAPQIRRAPAFAAQTGEVLREWLGLDDEEIAGLVEREALQTHAAREEPVPVGSGSSGTG